MSAGAGTSRRAEKELLVANEAVEPRPPYSIDAHVYELWLVIWRYKVHIVAASLLAGLATGLIAKFLLTKIYQANAIIRPASADKMLPGPLGGAASLLGLGSSLSAMSSSVQGDVVMPDEIVAMLNSYALTVDMAKRFGLRDKLFPIDPPPTPWKLYKAINGRFMCVNDQLTGNMTLSFFARSKPEAEEVLGYYIDTLRDRLSTEVAKSAEAAIAALRRQISLTTDSALQAQLAQLLAQQIQRKNLATVDSNFAFTVIEPPISDDKAFSPRPAIDSILAAIIAFFMFTLGVIGVHLRRRFRDGRGLLPPSATY